MAEYDSIHDLTTSQVQTPQDNANTGEVSFYIYYAITPIHASLYPKRKNANI